LKKNQRAALNRLSASVLGYLPVAHIHLIAIGKNEGAVHHQKNRRDHFLLWKTGDCLKRNRNTAESPGFCNFEKKEYIVGHPFIR
jgi:hypothetical protein